MKPSHQSDTDYKSISKSTR